MNPVETTIHFRSFPNLVFQAGRRLYDDSLHRNSLFLMASTGIMAVVGFFFWIVVARLYSPESIGLGGSLISVVSLLISLSTLGLPHTLIRFLSSSKKPNEQISMSLLLTAGMAVIVSISFWFISRYFLTELHSLINSPLNWLLFSIALIIGSWTTIIDSVFIAFKRTQWILLENTITSLSKLLIIFFFSSFLGFGIFLSNYVGISIAFIISLIIQIVIYKFTLTFSMNRLIVKEIGRYSAASYLAGLVGTIPSQVLPALITATIGAASAGHFFLALMMVNLLGIIPQANGQTLFSAGSSNPSILKKLTLNSLKFQLTLVIFGIVCFWIFGNIVLSVFSDEYAQEIVPVLRILSLGVLPMVVSAPLVTRLRVRRELRTLNVLTILSAGIILFTSWVGTKYDLIGVSFGYLFGQILAALLVITHFKITSHHNMNIFIENTENI